MPICNRMFAAVRKLKFECIHGKLRAVVLVGNVMDAKRAEVRDGVRPVRESTRFDNLAGDEEVGGRLRVFRMEVVAVVPCHLPTDAAEDLAFRLVEGSDDRREVHRSFKMRIGERGYVVHATSIEEGARARLHAEQCEVIVLVVEDHLVERAVRGVDAEPRGTIKRESNDAIDVFVNYHVDDVERVAVGLEDVVDGFDRAFVVLDDRVGADYSVVASIGQAGVGVRPLARSAEPVVSQRRLEKTLLITA